MVAVSHARVPITLHLHGKTLSGSRSQMLLVIQAGGHDQVPFHLCLQLVCILMYTRDGARRAP